jgi:hypothetical protein
MDVVLNDRDFAWDTRSPGVSGVADIQSLLTHEWGHAIGCDHVPLRESTMYFAADAGSVHLRSLAEDDIAIAGTIYPNSAFTSLTGTLRGVVDLTDSADDRAVHVVAVSVTTNLPVASTLTGQNGSWAIRGLPRGTYRVLCTPTLPLRGAMNAFWTSGRTNFLPAAASDDGTSANPVRAGVFDVRESADVVVPTIRTSAVTAPLEPNDTESAARTITLGDAVCGRFETASEFDWFAVDLTAGRPVTIALLAWGLGSDSDVTLRLQGPAGNVLANLVDDRGGIGQQNQPEGVDRDARLSAFSPTTSGRHTIRVSQGSAVSGATAFYVLLVNPSSRSPHPRLTTLTTDPTRIDADGASMTTLTLRPRREDGSDVGPGASVTFVHDGAGSLSAVSDRGDGTYVAALTAPTTRGHDRIGFTVTSADGSATRADAADIVYVGPPDAAKSSLTVTPRRVAAGGTATVSFLPRDADGEALGDGRAVSFSAAPATGLSFGAVNDHDDGTYSATLSVAAGAAESAVAGSVGGTVVPRTAPLYVGFDLADCLRTARLDTAAFVGIGELKASVRSLFAAADDRLAAAQSALGAGDARAAVNLTRAGLGKLVTGLSKAGAAATDPGTIRELGLAVRTRANAAIAAAVIGSGKDQKAVDAATALVAAADELALSDPKKAAARYAKAHTIAVRLAPR